MLNWTLGFSSGLDVEPEETIDVTPLQDDPNVPGEAQLLWCKAGKLPDYNYGSNVLQYAWCENVFWHYETVIDVKKKAGFEPTITFNYLDYRYTIRANGEVIADDEGMFTPVKLSLSKYEGLPVKIECILHPVPKIPRAKVGTRDEARESVKPPVSYSWDWHPRLVTAGISGEVIFAYEPVNRLNNCEIYYELNEALDLASIQISANVLGSAKSVSAYIIDADGNTVASTSVGAAQYVGLMLELKNPKLWWPARQGEQNLYTAKVVLEDESGEAVSEYSKSIGFRRVKLVMNKDGWDTPTPATQGKFPFTLEINGRRIFCKGSNFVSADIFYSKISEDNYRSLIGLALEANMNIFRMWGGSPVNKSVFFELCDKLGMMVWQEFPLACDNYPDKEKYLKKLEEEATTIVKDLRTHPSIVMWCGGNELFNGWSGMTNQSLALRVLDRVTLTHDKWTPYNMTSPVYGVGHGPYANIVDDNTGMESLELFQMSPRTAYTEFGCPGPAPLDYILKYMDESQVNDLFALQEVAKQNRPYSGIDNVDNSCAHPWFVHHAIAAHYPKDTWFRLNEIYQFFYKTDSVAECCELGAIIQGACYKVVFEEARRKWPYTSMAINWCWNEPWPCFANNTLVAYPNVVKLAYFDVKQALRDQMLSIRFTKLRHVPGDEFGVEIWALNDLPSEIKGSDYTIYLEYENEEDTRIELGKGHFDNIEELTAKKIGDAVVKIPEDITKTYRVVIKCENNDLSSNYTLFRID